MENVARTRIEKLRELMKKEGIDIYIVPSSDNHQSEYVGEYFKSRQFITGFAGSAGTAVITMDKAGLWTDGRYFIQAENQLKGSGVRLYKMSTPGFPKVEEFLKEEMPANGVLGFDGRTIGLKEGNSYKMKLSDKNVSIKYDKDLIDEIWNDRPAMACEKVFELDVKYAGESLEEKLERVRNIMKEEGASHHILTTLDDIAWLFNLRGSDVMYSPLFLSYAVVGENEAILFTDEKKLSDEIKKHLEKDNVRILPYDDIYEFVKGFNADNTVMLDPVRINYALYLNIPEETKIVERENPEIIFKAVKNETELENTRKAHIKDGVASVKLMYWLKTGIGKEKITELDVAEKYDEFRKQQEGYLWQSFSPICAFKDNAAMMHYSATKDSNAELSEGHLMLTDTGGNYYEGTTDITRTYALGEVPQLIKEHFTAVARGMINLSKVRFLYGARGLNLDILARGPMWDLDIDYKCGTGHGVGYLLNIHEGPQGFRWQMVPGKSETHILEEGMVITNEPGIYIEGSHGIRIENELIVRKGDSNVFGTFMYLEPITFVPIDLDAIDPELMNKDEIKYLNWYHSEVYKKISPYLDEDEKEWLRKYTRSI